MNIFCVHHVYHNSSSLLSTCTHEGIDHIQPPSAPPYLVENLESTLLIEEFVWRVCGREGGPVHNTSPLSPGGSRQESEST